jgi:hypothetical protein
MTNYEFWWDGGPWDRDDLAIGCINRDEWQRPEIGMEIRIKGRIVKITRTDPPNNPTGQKVKYFVEPVNGNWPYKNNE